MALDCSCIGLPGLLVAGGVSSFKRPLLEQQMHGSLQGRQWHLLVFVCFLFFLRDMLVMLPIYL